MPLLHLDSPQNFFMKKRSELKISVLQCCSLRVKTFLTTRTAAVRFPKKNGQNAQSASEALPPISAMPPLLTQLGRCNASTRHAAAPHPAARRICDLAQSAPHPLPAGARSRQKVGLGDWGPIVPRSPFRFKVVEATGLEMEIFCRALNYIGIVQKCSPVAGLPWTTCNL